MNEPRNPLSCALSPGNGRKNFQLPPGRAIAGDVFPTAPELTRSARPTRNSTRRYSKNFPPSSAFGTPNLPRPTSESSQIILRVARSYLSGPDAANLPRTTCLTDSSLPISNLPGRNSRYPQDECPAVRCKNQSSSGDKIRALPIRVFLHRTLPGR